MAMLAEPRRKQKWSVDPRNSAWSKDESKFGQKMLEKMGWSKGKGLGAQEQGNTEHVKVQLKNNTLGLGATANQEDNWIAHQDDFNQLLAELNNCHGQDTADAASKEEKRTFSLEEKSKSARKRVHYVKFAKGKDLSSRSEDDLSCIFGKRQAKKTQATESPKEDQKEEEDPSDEVDSGNTVTSALTVQEYFAKRMAKLKKAQREDDFRTAESPPAMAEESECLVAQPMKRKYPKHGCSESEDGLEGPEAKCPRDLGSSEEVEKLNTQKKNKRKKKKKSKHSSPGGGSLSCNGSQNGAQEKGSCGSGTSDAESNDSEQPRGKRKNKRKLDRDAGADVKKLKKKKRKKETLSS
ncbi:TERF1-interacting telomerase inhibitor 1 isoform X1 [Podarcis lilfordi]|uniref:TERF1-interacting telomerase inhibitor 1 isoform X1 n=1 Tax=Podarcis lilfordi TaxID=74358 RepID=A0AA35K665_9SAUR|nr:TERF1-interacting telomerase inhibitor 1 isoform X1 [Podarcis lilfordi]